ncbi:MAG: phosphatase PAP2 family protein [bacterium]|nr:phosphatase PAP2 family protein [bacterium]
MSFDFYIFQAFHNLANKSNFFDGLIVFLAGYLQYVLLALAIFLLLAKIKDWRHQLYIVSVFLLSAIISRGLITEIIRFFYHRLRPFLALNLTPLVKDFSGSFPSGHMTLYFALALTIFLISRKWTWFFVASVILMGLARIAAGVHWPSDIIGGILIAIISYFIVKKILPSNNKTAN